MNIFTYRAFVIDQFLAEYPIPLDVSGRFRTYDYKVVCRILEIPVRTMLPEQYNYCGWETSDFVENCIVIINRHWISDFFDNEIRNLAFIKNKKLILINQENCLVNRDDGDLLLTRFKEYLIKTNFDFKNVYVITQLHADIERINKFLPECHTCVLDGWLDEFMWFEGSDSKYVVENENLKIEGLKRFSIFSRRMDERRFHFYCGLLVNNVLANAYYTFSNLYDDLSYRFAIEDIKHMIPESIPNKNLVEDWISGIPYEVESVMSNHHNLPEMGYPSLLKTMFENSDMNIVQESNPIKESNILSEKTYKSIFYKKPFVLVAQPNTLELLRIAGYKTFDGIIDESYDLIDEYDLRAEAVLKEITRLNNLSNDDWDIVIKKCEPIIEHNYNRLMEIVNEPWPKSFTMLEIAQF